QMSDKLGVRLGQRRVVESLALGRRVREANLLCQDRLPRTGRSGDDDERAGLEPAAENEIEVWNPGLQPSHVSLYLLGSGGPRRAGVPGPRMVCRDECWPRQPGGSCR